MQMCLLSFLSIILLISVFRLSTTDVGRWPYEIQRYDGWYNNPRQPYGISGAHLIHKSGSAYSDHVKSMAGSDRPPAGIISDKIFGGPDGLAPAKNFTALFAFFGQVVASEIVSTSSLGEIACPVEKSTLTVGKFGQCSSSPGGNVQCEEIATKRLPFFRAPFDKKTGRFTNAPRKLINQVTSYIDGNFVYGISQPWADSLRSFVDGKLLMEDDDKLPTDDRLGIPFVNLPHPDYPLANEDPSARLALGSFKSNQHPPLQSLSILFHKWHNVLADQIKRERPNWPDEYLFQRSRQWLVATLQNLILYEYLPALFGEPAVAPYSGYNADTNPGVTVEFQSAAFRFGHTMLPSGFFVVDESCRDFKPISLCSTWWNSSAFVKETGFASILRGILAQRAEKADHILSIAVRRHMFGLLRSAGHDLGALNIMRGRDAGVADYNTVRRAYGMEAITKWSEINPDLTDLEPELISTLEVLYGNSTQNIDLFVGGLLETDVATGFPGETFKRIIIDQFQRIRDSDRFWFENKANGLFTDEEIAQIRSTTFRDILIRAGELEPSQIPNNPLIHEEWNLNGSSPFCLQPYQLNWSVLTPCYESESYDFFSGSEVSFVLTFMFLALVPLLCCLAGWLIAKHKSRIFKRSLTRGVTKRLKDTFVAFEQTDKIRSRKVQLKFGPGSTIQVMNKEAGVVRTIEMKNRYNVTLKHTYDTTKNAIILMSVPKEYDLILVFDTIPERKEFALALTQYLRSLNITVTDAFLSLNELFVVAVTYSQRQKILEIFFRTAFNQIFRAQKKTTGSSLSPHRWPAYVKSIHNRQANVKEHKQLLGLELNRQEFAQALQLSPESLFVKQMFTLADKDHNGYISYPEFIDILALLSKGSLENKMRMLFDMYDLDGSCDLDVEEFTAMIKSLVDMANNNMSKKQVDDMVNGMLSVCDLDDKCLMTFDDFYCLIQRYQHDLWAEFNEQVFGCFTKNEKDIMDNCLSSPTLRFVVTRFEDLSKWKSTYRFIMYYLENNTNKIVTLTLFVLFTCYFVLDSLTACYYLAEDRGVRKIAGISACFARGSATGISFCYGVLLLSVCRNVMTVVRDTALGSFIPLDSAIAFHRFVAWVALGLTAAHMLAHAINFYKIGTQPPIILRCIFPALQLDMDFMPKFDYWIFLTIPGLTGVLLTLLLSIMYVFGSGTARKHIYQTFWATHRLFGVVYGLTLLHGTLGLIQPQSFHWFVGGPIVVYVCDWLISLRSQEIELKIINVEVLPSDVLHLSFKLPATVTFYSGQYIRLASCDISAKEFHPFTITSAPHERVLSCHIRAVGPWTRSLLDSFSSRLSENKPYPKMLLDGPYGSIHQDWYKYEAVVLIGAGIGVTPTASVLKDLVHKVYSTRLDIACKRVYFAWISRNHTQFEWFMDVLRDVEKVDARNLIHMDIFISQLLKDFDIRTTMLYICEHQFQRLSNRSLFTGLKAKTHFGRIDFEEYFGAIQQRHLSISKIGVFTCGPKSLVQSVKSACSKINKSKNRVAFVPHHEVF